MSWREHPLDEFSYFNAIDQCIRYADEKHEKLAIHPPEFKDWVDVHSDVHETQEELEEYINHWCSTRTWIDDETSLRTTEHDGDDSWYMIQYYNEDKEIVNTLRIKVVAEVATKATATFSSVE